MRTRWPLAVIFPLLTPLRKSRFPKCCDAQAASPPSFRLAANVNKLAGPPSGLQHKVATYPPGDVARERPDAVFVSPDPFFRSRRVHLALLAMRHAVPSTYALRDYAEAGGLMSYGASLTDAYRQVGVYAGRILKGLSRPNCRLCSRRSSSWSSTRRPPGCSASLYRHRSSPPLTR